MSIIIKKIRYTQKPPPGTRLDRTNPLTKGMVGCWVFNEKNSTVIDNLAYPSYTLLNNGTAATPAYKNFKGEYGYNFRGSPVDYLTGLDRFPFKLTGNLSIHARFYTTTVAAGNVYILNKFIFTADNNNGGYGLRLSTNKMTGFAINNEATPYPQEVTGATTIVTNKIYQATFTYDGTSKKIYLNGKLDGTSVDSTNPKDVTQSLIMGAYSGNTSQSPWSGVIFLCYLWDRGLNGSEVRKLNDNPYRILQKRRISVYIPNSQSNPNATINFNGSNFRTDILFSGVTILTNQSSLATPTISTSTITVFSPSTLISNHAIANPSLASVSVIIGQATASTSSSSSATATPSLVSVSVIINQATGSTSSSVSSTATPAIARATITILSPTINISKNINIFPGTNIVTISIPSPTTSIQQNRLVQPSAQTVTVIINQPTITTGTSGGVTVLLLLKSQIEKQINKQSRIEKRIGLKSIINP